MKDRERIIPKERIFMKTAIIYYSLEGNTDSIAQKIAENSSAELIRLIPQKEYPTGNFSKYIWGGKSVTFGERPKLTNKNLTLADYDTIIIGSPIWASSYTPPMNTFFHDYPIKGKKVILFTSSAGGESAKAVAKMKEKLVGNEILGVVDFKDPLKGSDSGVKEKVKQIRQLAGIERS